MTRQEITSGETRMDDNVERLKDEEKPAEGVTSSLHGKRELVSTVDG